MDEHNTGMDPEVKQYFRKIINSFAVGLLWLMVMVTAGLFFGLGVAHNGLRWYNGVFYVIFLVTFIWVARYFYRAWSKKG
jgi:membrane protein DedA with SNARE-associated domain